MSQEKQPGAAGTALRIGAIGALISGAFSLADPIFGATLSRAGAGFSDASTGSIARDLQVALLVAGVIICVTVGALASWQGRSFALGLLAAVIAGLLGAVVGALINIGASYVATDAEVNYLVAQSGDVSLSMGQAGATGTVIAYGIIATVFGVVQGVVCGLIGGLGGRLAAVGGKVPVHAGM